MGKLILCTSRVAVNPYVFPLSEIRVYSIEELCYYIYHNIYEITSECFDEKLVDWLRNEIGMDIMAQKLETMISINSSLKDIVVSILCSCDYYSEEEIKALLVLINEIENLPFHGRQKQKADYCLKYGRYAKAKREYDRILYGGYAVNLSAVEYGNILHNRSLACFNMGSYRESAAGWKEAYSRNNSAESLRQYLIALLLTGDTARFEQEAGTYGFTREQANEVRNEVDQASKQATEGSDYESIQKIVKYASSDEAVGFALKKLKVWKKQYREGNS